MPPSLVFQLFSGGKENNPKLFWDFFCCCCWSHVLLGICLGLWHESLGTSCDCLAYEWEHPHPAPSPLTKGGQTAVAWKPKLVTILLCCAAMNLPLLFLVAQHLNVSFKWLVFHSKTKERVMVTLSLVFAVSKQKKMMLFLSTFNRLLKHVTNKNDSQR